MGYIKDENFVNIQGWMRTKLGLSGTELLIYAIIFQKSNAGSRWFRTTQQYFAEWCGCTRQSVIIAMNKLVENELITKRRETDENGYLRECSYKVVLVRGE